MSATRHIRRTQDDEVKRLRTIAGISKFAAIVHDKTPAELFAHLRDNYYAREITGLCQIYDIENYSHCNHKVDRIRLIIDWLNSFGLIDTPERKQNWDAHAKDREEAREWLIPFDAEDNFKDFLDNGDWPIDMIARARDLAAKLDAYSQEHNGVGLKLFDRSKNEFVIKYPHINSVCLSYSDKHSFDELTAILVSFGMPKILLDECASSRYPECTAGQYISKIIVAFLNRFDAQNDDSQHELPATADDAISANDNDSALASQPATVANAESSQPDALYDDDSFSDAPGDNSCPDMDIPGEYVLDDTEKKQEFFADDSYMHYKPYVAARLIFKPGHKFCDYDGIIYTVISRSKSFITFRDNKGNTIRRKPAAFVLVNSLYDTYAEMVYIGNNHYRAKCKTLKANMVFIPDETQTEIPAPADNPGFTIVPSEHIERPQYTAYPDTITDECPYVTVPACDIPENHSSAAVVPYADFAHIRNFFRLIALYLRLWLAMNITPSENPLDDFPDGLFTHYATRKKPRAKFRRAVFEVGSSYSASSYSTSKGLQSFTFLVTGRCVYEDTYNKRKNVMLFITCNSPDNHDFEGRGVIRFIDTDHGVEVYNDRRYYEMGCGWRVFSFRPDKRDNVPFPFKNTTPGDPNYKPCGNATRFLSREFLNYSDNPDPVQEIHAETREITPKKDWDKIIADNPHSVINFEYDDFKHVKHAGHIHDRINKHNFALIDACKSHDEIRQFLAGVTKPALIGIMEHTADYFGTCGGYHEKEMDSIPHMIDLLIKRIDYCREDKAYWTEVKKRKTQQQHKSRNPESNPASATADIEHKLIDTQNLHFAEKRKALEHNATVITSCMFPEAVISLLLSISAKAVLQLGFHMGLFIAKPKGSKIAIAESFAERLITRRDIRANIRTKSDNTDAKHIANVPDGVKIFVGARRQICFKFED